MYGICYLGKICKGSTTLIGLAIRLFCFLFIGSFIIKEEGERVKCLLATYLRSSYKNSLVKTFVRGIYTK